MALLDRFRSLPVTKHPDPDVRLAHVESLTIDEREQLASFAREDESPKVRRAAVGKLMDPSVLALVNRDDADGGVRAQAASMLRDIALEAFEETGESDSLAAVSALSDPKILSQIAKAATRASVAERALDRVDDPRSRGSIARHAVLESIRAAACASLTDREELIAVALNSGFKDTAVAAVDRLTDRADLAHVAERSNNKNAVKRARVVVREMDDQAARSAAAAVPPLPDPEEAPQAAELIDDVRPLDAAPLADDFAPEAGRGSDAEAEADITRQDAERVAAEQALAHVAASDQASKEVERRRERLVELVVEIESAVADEDLRSARRRHAFAQREWRDLTAKEPPAEALVERFAAADSRLTVRDHEAKEADRRARREALAHVNELLDRVEALASNDDASSKAAERGLRDVRGALGHVPPLPSKQDYDDVMRRLKAAQAALTPKLQALREIEGWQRWANVGIQEQLCEKMEALTSEENPEEVAHRIRDLQQQWRQAADVPRAQSDALWQRFKKAHDDVWARCEAHFAAEAATRDENLKKKIALCDRVEALGDSTRWIQTADEIKTLQAEWKTIGPVPRGQEKAVWERFRAACDRFFSRRHDDLAKRKLAWTENFAKKEALCVQVEALVDSTDWDPAAAEIKRLQAEWKTIGPVKKSRSEIVWQRFRAACDRFFARYAQRHEIARGERVAAREAICAEVEAAAASAPASDESATPESAADLLARVRTLRARWQQEIAARGVEPSRAAELDRRFAAAFEQLRAARPEVFSGTDLDPEANRQRMEAIVGRVEKLAASLRGSSGDDAVLSPTTRLAAMLKEALASNTIGGKVDESSRVRAAQEDVRQAQASWSRIGHVPEAVRRTLSDRFQRACRLIAEAGQAAGAGGPGPGAATGTGRPGGAGRPSGSGRPSGAGGSVRS
ncbi:MAG: DUF349 domain-containing protein [Acidobacteriota bacterium]